MGQCSLSVVAEVNTVITFAFAIVFLNFYTAILLSRLEAMEQFSYPLPPLSPSDDLRPPHSYRCCGFAMG